MIITSTEHLGDNSRFGGDRCVFVDSAGFVALVDPDQGTHERAKAIMSQAEGSGRFFLTTEWVLSEFLASMSKIYGSRRRSIGIEFIDAIIRSRHIGALRAGEDDWQGGFSLYRSRPDKEWSLVDCISIRVCRERRIQDVLTTDDDFRQAGLVALLRHGGS